ncbi:cbb3-type cytochrome oxidase assembly protein CcoS [Lysobacteraceae bacterium NML75-0749]|nr:cbb3-type cytochrome oxidase assembly protein CcoS [Xanthomonadaceae bacterium NML03-0222]PJJ98952.1 cbb3-type cytochrome oxidase assembly protein CcoS [Xanthomonadaceae bacterium NML75-0749]PJK03692.1 cbb3-type cytochrome oxidase assembly protein CcoS [Xanthomonadaceae bacterium NML91-0268]
MNILLALIPISLMLIAVAVAAFVWAVKRGQYEDLDTPALDILREDPNERIAREREAAQSAEQQRDAD